MTAPTIRCQCPEEGVLTPGYEGWYDRETELPFVKHDPGQCQCVNNLRLFKRDGKQMWLCSCCCMPGDERIDQ